VIPWRWRWAVFFVLAVAIVTRIHNLTAYPPLHEFDGPGHGVNVLALERGELPDVRSWGGFHPPLYYALGAAVWRVMPERVPVHVGLRAISLLAGIVLAVVIWRTLRRLVSPVDAAIVATLVFCSPVFSMASGMLGNEMLCACLLTLALARLCFLPGTDSVVRHATVTALWLAAALLTKSTALGAVGAAAIAYLLAARAAPRRALKAATLVVVIPLLAAAPHYARLLRASGGSPMSVVSGAAMAPAVEAEMRAQPPGTRHWADYVSLPAATFLAPHWSAPGLVHSVPGLVYASLWADAHGQFLPAADARVMTAAALLSMAGLAPTLLLLAGALRVLREPRRLAGFAGPFVFAALLLLAFGRYTWVLPSYSAVKASYLLAASLPAALLLAFGLEALGPRSLATARGYCLALSCFATLVMWQGWWA
jgi:hypothetical protein